MVSGQGGLDGVDAHQVFAQEIKKSEPARVRIQSPALMARTVLEITLSKMIA
jgi:hypothetical protein